MPPEYVRTSLLARLGEVEVRQQLVRPVTCRAAVEVVEATDQLEVLEAGEVLVDGRILSREADSLPQARRFAAHVDAGNARTAGVGLDERRQDADGCRLACAVRAEQAETMPDATSRSMPASATTSR